MLIILFPALFTQVINLDGIETFWFAIPVVNVLLALRELLYEPCGLRPRGGLGWCLQPYAVGAAYYAACQFSFFVEKTSDLFLS